MVQFSRKSLRISRKTKGDQQMSRIADIEEGQALIQEVFSITTHGSVQQACYAAFRKLKLATLRRAETIWQGTVKRIDSWEVDALRYEKAMQNETATIHQLESTAATLAQIDPEFYRPTIDQLRHVASGIRQRGRDNKFENQ